MINGSFVFGMDDDGEDVFHRTVDWAIEHGITTATFHIQTPYPGTRLHARMVREGRMLPGTGIFTTRRHVVYRPAQLKPEALKAGYDWAYREFYRWTSIARAALHHGTLKHQAKHFFYASGWKKFEAGVGFSNPGKAAHSGDASVGRCTLAGHQRDGISTDGVRKPTRDPALGASMTQRKN